MSRKVRLQVALARLGCASRRGAAEIILAGRVKVNNAVIRQPGHRVEIDKDIITVDGKSVNLQKKIYLMLHKPKGVVSTVKDRFAALSVIKLVKLKDTRIYPIGRLDKDTTGLLLLTNDGQLAYRLTHPKFGIKKIYQVGVKGRIGRENLHRLEQGIFMEGKKTFPCKIKLLAEKEDTTLLEVRLSEGRKRQLKMMFSCIGHAVTFIRRVEFGPLKLGALRPGQWRWLTPIELARLHKATGLSSTNTKILKQASEGRFR